MTGHWSAGGWLVLHPCLHASIGFSGASPARGRDWVQDAAGSSLFNGLRVRMGVATGDVSKGQDFKATFAWDMAKGAPAGSRRPPPQ